MIDLAVPRDVEAEVGRARRCVSVQRGRSRQDRAGRPRHAPGRGGAGGGDHQRQACIDFMHWFETRELVPTIRALRDQAERMRRHEFDRAAKLLAKGDRPAEGARAALPCADQQIPACTDPRAQFRGSQGTRVPGRHARPPLPGESAGMKPSIASKLAQLSARLEELNALLSGEDVTKDLDNYRKLTREHAEIAPVVALYNAYMASERDVASALQIGRRSGNARTGRGRNARRQTEARRHRGRVATAVAAQGSERRAQYLHGNPRRYRRGRIGVCLPATCSACTHATPSARAGKWT